jgi:hypothetical protein
MADDTRTIRVLKGVGGTPRWRPGELVELPAEEAEKWADGHRAEYVDPPNPSPEPEVEEEELDPPTGDEEPADVVGEPPAGNASKDEWAAYVVNVLKVDPADIEGLGRNELRDRYGAPMDTEA